MRNKSEKEMEALAKLEPECTAMMRVERKLKRLKGKRWRRGGRSNLDIIAMAAMAYYAYTVGERTGREKAGL